MSEETKKIREAKQEDITVVISHGGDAGGVYVKGELVRTGHASDVVEALVEARFSVEYVDNIVTNPEVRGWAGVAKTLGELGL